MLPSLFARLVQLSRQGTPILHGNERKRIVLLACFASKKRSFYIPKGMFKTEKISNLLAAETKMRTHFTSRNSLPHHQMPRFLEGWKQSEGERIAIHTCSPEHSPVFLVCFLPNCNPQLPSQSQFKTELSSTIQYTR